MLRSLHQWHNQAGQTISQAMVGESVTFDVPGLPRQVWIEQTQNGNPQYTGVLSLPVQYTFYQRDIGIFNARLYDVVNGGKGSNLLYSYIFTVTATPTTPSALAPVPVAGQGSMCAQVQYPDGSVQINGPIVGSTAAYKTLIESQPGMKVLSFFVCGSNIPTATGGINPYNPTLISGPGMIDSVVSSAISPSITPGLPGSVPTGQAVGQTAPSVLSGLYRFYLWMGNGYSTGANYQGCSRVNSSLCDPQWFGGTKDQSLAAVLAYASAHGETPYEVFSADEPFQLITGTIHMDPSRIKSGFGIPWWLLALGGIALLSGRRSS